MIPGEIITKKDEIIINKGKNVIELVVSNSGDRPIQVGSHFHFFECWIAGPGRDDHFLEF